MKATYRWNSYSDQPDISIPKKKRFFHHLKHFKSYLTIAAANIRRGPSIISLYRQYWKSLYTNPIEIRDPFAVSVSPAGSRNNDLIRMLKEIGTTQTLLRVHSWEQDKLGEAEDLCRLLKREGIDISIALLQEREDVLAPHRWQSFTDRVFARFESYSSFFEIGHAWNRVKWGLWDHREYLKLSRSALEQARKHDVKLIGPAVIDFEFHLYPPVLKDIPFDVVSSLLYVDRMGAPENRQCGWDTRRKVALLRAMVDASVSYFPPLWITEVNWPLKGTGKYSPVGGKPNVTENEQASYLVRYYVLCLASGLVDRIYWWQLVAPGYGLVDSRKDPWRRRPGFYAFQTLVSHLRGSIFQNKIPHPHAEIFAFQKGQDRFAIIWTKDRENWGRSSIPFEIIRVEDRVGKEVPFEKNQIQIDGNPRYVFFRNQ